MSTGGVYWCVKRWMLGAACAPLVFVAACGSSHADVPPPTGMSSPEPVSTQPEILAQAGPLAAHIEKTTEVICDSSTATAFVTGRGFTVHLSFPAPAVATVSVMSVDEVTGQQTYTLGGSDTGHDFAFTEFPLSQAETVTVYVMSDRGTGGCEVIDRTQG